MSDDDTGSTSLVAIGRLGQVRGEFETIDVKRRSIWISIDYWRGGSRGSGLREGVGPEPERERALGEFGDLRHRLLVGGLVDVVDDLGALVAQEAEVFEPAVSLHAPQSSRRTKQPRGRSPRVVHVLLETRIAAPPKR